MSEDIDAMERRAIYRIAPVVAIANAITTLGFAAGVIAWAIAQERTDARQDAEIVSLVAGVKRNGEDIKDYRDQIIRSLEKINDELKEMNRRLAATGK